MYFNGRRSYGVFMIQTDRLTLRRWTIADYPAFARMNADPEVMADLGGPFVRTASDGKLDCYSAAWTGHGISRWAVDNADGAFIGYAGVMFRPSADHPLGPHHEIGWRFIRAAWGHGHATESARAALDHAFKREGLREIVAYTAADNLRSQAVMKRVGLQRDPSRDFVAEYPSGPWRGLVWAASMT